MLGDDDGGVGDVDVNRHPVGRGDAQGHRDGLRDRTSDRDRHDGDPRHEIDDPSSLPRRHVGVARVEGEGGLHRGRGSKEPLQGDATGTVNLGRPGSTALRSGRLRRGRRRRPQGPRRRGRAHRAEPGRAVILDRRFRRSRMGLGRRLSGCLAGAEDASVDTVSGERDGLVPVPTMRRRGPATSALLLPRHRPVPPPHKTPRRNHCDGPHRRYPNRAGDRAGSARADRVGTCSSPLISTEHFYARTPPFLPGISRLLRLPKQPGFTSSR